ncbi:uncharacterized protein SPAPADRAFT_57543 [Spathaspora passalidarum NRRL Y-27907]|uniref:Efficient mitochondria targeting-associated protein 19 n=1 Tax=Spathaspora passalidarum (strain NRRL Y-27907 / 11-Y1) TaxID=619300 RepID=G3AV07_SPAPN|nr:uncharacterized protein SPAPADRAFT_57543 [Spathaspora passalidarum NRRL Y-27907]EGW30081.1 hypothetical protein SPAPADRAFT_57543 [Spathaspora passalidarum NRRL Y-27907]
MKTVDKIFLIYFISHIPITIFMDSTIIVPKEYQLELSKTLLDFHISANKDILLIHSPTWFKLFGVVELVFQLPLFFYFIYKLLVAPVLDSDYFIWTIVYGFNASFTTFVCMGWIIIEGQDLGLNLQEIANLCAIYSPYLIIPAWLLLNSISRLRKIKTD